MMGGGKIACILALIPLIKMIWSIFNEPYQDIKTEKIDSAYK